MKHKKQLEQIALKACRKIMANTKATMAKGCGRYEPCPRAAQFTYAGETNQYGQHRIELGVGAKRKLVIAATISLRDGAAHFIAYWQNKNGKATNPIFDMRRYCIDGLATDIDDMTDVLISWLLQPHLKLNLAIDDERAAA